MALMIEKFKTYGQVKKIKLDLEGEKNNGDKTIEFKDDISIFNRSKKSCQEFMKYFSVKIIKK